MNKIISFIIISLFWCNISVAKNLSEIIGEKKRAAHYHNCKVVEGSKKIDERYEFGIVYGKGTGEKGWFGALNGDHFVISYNKKTKRYETPISANLYFKNKINDETYDVQVHFVLSSPEFRKDIGPAIGMNIVMSSFVRGNDAALLRYWFEANSHKSNDKLLYEELVEILNTENKRMLDKKLTEFTNKIFEITTKHLNLSEPFSLIEFDERMQGKIELDKNLKDNRLLDWTTYDCKTKLPK